MPILSKPYVITDAGRQSEDIDRMFDDVYTEMAELEREQAVADGGGAGGSQRGVPGEDGDDSDAGLWTLPVTRSSTSLVDTTNLARLNTVQSFSAANTWTATGNNFDEILATDKGLQFPATQVADSGANVLDDYEEGSWTPTVTGSTSASGQAYDIQVGRYVKIGKLCEVHCRVRLTTLGTITGNVRIGGLPFTWENTANAYSGCPVGFFVGLTTGVVFINGFPVLGAAQLELVMLTAAATATSALAQADLSNTSDFIISCVLRTDA